jgi:hypothetical protein
MFENTDNTPKDIFCRLVMLHLHDQNQSLEYRTHLQDRYYDFDNNLLLRSIPGTPDWFRHY